MEKQKQKGFKQINSKTAHSFKFFSDRKKQIVSFIRMKCIHLRPQKKISYQFSPVAKNSVSYEYHSFLFSSPENAL